jgi:hypothetical protein
MSEQCRVHLHELESPGLRMAHHHDVPVEVGLDDWDRSERIRQILPA